MHAVDLGQTHRYPLHHPGLPHLQGADAPSRDKAAAHTVGELAVEGRGVLGAVHELHAGELPIPVDEPLRGLPVDAQYDGPVLSRVLVEHTDDHVGHSVGKHLEAESGAVFAPVGTGVAGQVGLEVRQELAAGPVCVQRHGHLHPREICNGCLHCAHTYGTLVVAHESFIVSNTA